jgi:hypothetical protein
MTDISQHVYKEGDKFYFDPEIYSDGIADKLSIDYEEGDMIKWEWENKKMLGTLRQVGHEVGLFLIQNVSNV